MTRQSGASKPGIDWDAAYGSGKRYSQLSQDELVTVFEDFPKGSTVLDLGCGAGELACQLWEMGYKVTGVDISGEAISLAKQRCSGPVFIQSAVEDFQIKPVDVIVMNKFLVFVEDKISLLAKAMKNSDSIILITPVIDSSINATSHQRAISFIASELEQLLNDNFDTVKKAFDTEKSPGYYLRAYKLS